MPHYRHKRTVVHRQYEKVPTFWEKVGEALGAMVFVVVILVVLANVLT